MDAGRPGPALTEAETAVTEALQAGYLPVTAEAYYLLGTAQRVKGDAPNAEKSFFESLRAAEAGRDDRQVGYALGGLLWVTGAMAARYAEAHRSAALARSVIERLRGDATLESLVEGNEGVVYSKEGNFADAQRLLERTVLLRQKALGADHLDVAKTLTNLGAVYVAEGRHSDATAPYERARRIFEQQLGAEHPLTATVLNNQIEVYAMQGRFEEARATAEQALAIRERALGPEHINTATSLLNLAEVLQKEGKNEAALEKYRRVVAIYERRSARRMFTWPTRSRASARSSSRWAAPRGSDAPRAGPRPAGERGRAVQGSSHEVRARSSAVGHGPRPRPSTDPRRRGARRLRRRRQAVRRGRRPRQQMARRAQVRRRPHISLSPDPLRRRGGYFIERAMCAPRRSPGARHERG